MTAPETNATASDLDGDGLDDPTEVRGATDPTATDTDSHGLADGAERDQGTDPRKADTDGDGVDDAPDVAPGNPSRSTPTPTMTPLSQTTAEDGPGVGIASAIAGVPGLCVLWRRARSQSRSANYR